ncbi:histidine phosphotransferase family protein [Wolbachia endosymbiont of Tettigetta isshikii]|uniref:histidine phosphotransferase family protein n=1 Tax=Wolbachia endosymbiont of Tettigetta isshikii TaxID=3239093 RepID=UPI0039805D70
MLLITELLSGRLLHDFANSMNGIMFTLEELEASDKNDSGSWKEALSLLMESSNDLMHKYKVMKQAYSSSADNRSFDRTKLNIENYLLKKKIKFTWKTDAHFVKCKTSLIEKINKIISNMVITIASAVAEVERMSVLLSQEKDKTLLTMQVSSEYKPLSKSLVMKLSKKRDDNLNTKDISIYMTYLLLEYYNAKIHCTCENNLLEIGLTLT